MKNRDKLRIGGSILASKLTGRPRPFFVQYSLLNACNASCGYCNCPQREDPRADLATHLRTLADFSRLGAVRIKFLGGEPLLHGDIAQLVDVTKQHGMRAAMVTNGFLIPQKMDVVRRLDEVVISIDGSEAAHDAQRGRGTWKKVMNAIDACAAEGLDFFLSAVVTRDTVGEIDWLLDTARRYRVMVNFQIPQFNPEMYGSGAKSWMPMPDEIRNVIARIIAAKEDGAPVLFSTRSYGRTLQWEDFSRERDERSGEASPCTAGKYFLQLEPNGDIYPCVLQIGSFQPKNAFRDGVETAWRHASAHSCFSCYNTWLNENRGIFELHPSILLNFWQNYLRARG
ncbi:MAG: radical SAM protein [Acidobacteria bacterium]|nr:radical SAM protein [Acidobacteriota bacterium]MBV9474864.1 radical SAM protein [Acidobacteriota bacterium]